MGVHVGVDVGGTFTDLFAVDAADGSVHTEKTDTTPDAVSGVIEAIRQSGIDAGTIESLVFGSTIATNALVENTVEPVAFLGTQGFTDILETRRLWREHLFGWKWDRPRALVASDLRFGVPGRIDWRGREIEPLDLAVIDRAIARIRQRGICAVAVSYLFSFLNPDHERRTGERFSALAPEIDVTLSHDVNPEIKEYERASTTVVAASLAPIVGRMMDELVTGLRRHGVPAVPRVIKSNGGVMSARIARAKPLEIVRSGPAGGVASAIRLARDLERPNLITLDIGGTTADVAVITDGAVRHSEQTNIAWDIPIRAAMADVRSIGAGGGSIAHLDRAERLHVGPRSAGAVPGPACYGRGGREPTVTDAAVVAGLVDPARFLGGRMAVSRDAAAEALVRSVAEPLGLDIADAASGVIHVITMRMAQLINEMTVQTGLDPRRYWLVGFGGAGPLFAGALSDEIEALGALVPPYPAVWSAFGGLYADVVHDYAHSHLCLLRDLAADDMAEIVRRFSDAAARDLADDGLKLESARIEHAFDVRYKGQSHHLRVPVDLSEGLTEASLRAVETRFEAMHEAMYGHTRPGDAQQLVTVRALVRVARTLPPAQVAGRRPSGEDGPRRRPVYFHGEEAAVATTVRNRSDLAPGTRIDGPLIVEEDQSNTVVPPGLRLTVAGGGVLQIERNAP